MYTHPWWIHWKSRENEFLHVVLAAYAQYECVLPILDRLHDQMPAPPAWPVIAARMNWGRDQMDRFRRRTKRKKGTPRFNIVADAPYAPNTGGLSYGLLADLARYFKTEVSELIPPISVYYTGSTRYFIQKVLEESDHDPTLPDDIPPPADVWAYARYYIALGWEPPGIASETDLHAEAVAEVIAKNGKDAYFTVTKSAPFVFENAEDVEEAILRTRSVLDTLLAWLEVRNLFRPRGA